MKSEKRVLSSVAEYYLPILSTLFPPGEHGHCFIHRAITFSRNGFQNRSHCACLCPTLAATPPPAAVPPTTSNSIALPFTPLAPNFGHGGDGDGEEAVEAFDDDVVAVLGSPCVA